jgi:hypothetical protein
VLKQISSEPPTFDIQATVSYQTQLISSFVHRTLFKFVNGAKFGPRTSLVPDLALKADASADGRPTPSRCDRACAGSRSRRSTGASSPADVKYTIERAVKKSPYAT